MRRLVALILAALAFVQPSAALTPAQELVLFGGNAPVFYANPTSGQIPPWLSYASAGVRYYFDAAANLQTAPNNLILNSAVFSTQTVAVTSGASYVLSATMASGNSIAATGAATATLNGSGGGTRVFVSFTASSASVTLALTGAATQAQLEQVTAAQTAPNPFMPTTGSAYYGPVINDHNPSTLASLGLRSEPQRTNYIRNNTMQGASAGVAPTFWTVSSSSNGVTLTQGAPVVAFGMTWLPFTFSGTATATITSTSVFFSEGTQQIAAVSGQTWTAAFYAYSTGILPGLEINLAERTSAGAPNISNEVNITTTSTPTLFQATKTIASASTAYVVTRLDYNTVAGAVYSGTVYVAAPSTAQNSFATSPILTYGAAVTAPADNWSFTGAALAALRSPIGCYAVEFTPEGLTTGVNSIIKSTSTGSFGADITTAATETSLANIASIATNAISPTVNAKSRVAAKWAPGNYAVATNGAGLTTVAYGSAQTPAAAYYLGQNGTAAPLSAWFSQIMIRQNCTAAQVQRYSTAGANLRGN